MIIDYGIQVNLKEPNDFLKIRETLSRIGISSRKDKTLYQSCHILHKRGEYYILHFKEMFLLDNKESNISEEDVKRRNCIAWLLEAWGLLTIVDKDKAAERLPVSQIKVVPYKEKEDWTFITKYSIGTKKS
ncbi:endoribonulcease translational repressor of early genes [Synechococcus phage BUCT-ZZ01]|nr:endoribonulcease translational repressor of early genes [Synechococcus phage BUCT-ZZ01]